MSVASVPVPAFLMASATAKAMWKTSVACAAGLARFTNAVAQTSLKVHAIATALSRMNAAFAVVLVSQKVRAIATATSKMNAACAAVLASQKVRAIATATCWMNAAFVMEMEQHVQAARTPWLATLILRQE